MGGLYMYIHIAPGLSWGSPGLYWESWLSWPPGVPPWFPPGDSPGSRIPQGFWEAQKIAHNVVLSTARAFSKPPRGCVYMLSYPVGCTLSLCGPWRLLARWATWSLRGSPRGSLGECETHGLSPRISHKGFPGGMPQGISHGIHQGSPRGSPRV